MDLSLIRRIYEAAEDSTRWSMFLQSFIEAINTTQALLVVSIPRDPRFAISASTGITDEALAIAANPTYRDPWFSRVNFATYPHNRVIPSNTIVPDHILESDPGYQQLSLRFNWHYGGGVILDMPEGDLAVMSTLRPREMGPLTDDEIETWQDLVPHIAQGIRLSSKITDLSANRTLMLAQFDLLGHGALLASPSRKILAANHQAHRIANRGDAISFAKGHLQCHHPESQRQLAQTLCPPAPLSKAGTTRLSLRNSDGETKLLAILTPALPGDTKQLPLNQIATAIHLIDLEESFEFDPAPLRSLYGLTKAEARLSCRLASGDSLAEAAKRLSVSINTVRTQLQRTLAKMHLCRQSELIVIVRKVSPRVT